MNPIGSLTSSATPLDAAAAAALEFSVSILTVKVQTIRISVETRNGEEVLSDGGGKLCRHFCGKSAV